MAHYFSAHSKDLNFFVKCGVNNCPATFRRYHSFYKHVARNHKEEYQTDIGGPGDILRNNHDTIIINAEIQHADQDLPVNLHQNIDQFDLATSDSSRDETDSSCDSSGYEYDAETANGEVGR